jgi:uncharacterized protein YrrD
MQFKKNAPVYTADNQQVGAIDRVVLTPQTNEVSHIVIRQGWFFTEDKVAPIELVEMATEDRVQLRRDVKNLDALPQFEEVSYIPYNTDDETAPGSSNTRKSETDAVPSVADDSATTTTYSTVTDALSLYGYPAVGMGWPTYDLGYYGYPDELYTVKVKRHIPTGTVALKEGATVVDSQGTSLGTVKRVFINDESDQATHLLISEGWIFKEQKIVPLDWVKTVTEDEVQLYVKADLLNRLPAYQE